MLKISGSGGGKEARKMLKIPTGIDALDIPVNGGLPSGSVYLLFGRAGVGKSEFIHTIAVKHAAINLGQTPKPKEEEIHIPKYVWYINFSREPDELLNDVAGTFSREFYGTFAKGVSFRDFTSLSSMDESLSWLPNSFKASLMILSLAQFLKEYGQNSTIIIYTLTDLAEHFQGTSEHDFASFLQGLRLQAKKWNGIIYAILSEGILSRGMELNIISTADGVFRFTEQFRATGRQVLVSCQKSRGLPPNLLSSVFEMNVTPDGVVLQKVRTLEGRR